MFREVEGIIKHRVLLNYRIDPDVMSQNLPTEFKLKLVKGFAIAGICQVSLADMRPKGFPAFLGLDSNNAAYRVAVQSDGGEGVYIFRRDTDSWINALSGGRLFPGI